MPAANPMELRHVTGWARNLVALAAAAVLATTAFTVLAADRADAQPSASDWYVIESRHSGLVLDIQGASTSTGARLTQYTNYQGTNQQYRFIDLGNGYYTIQVRHSGQVLDVQGGSTADGAAVTQYTRHDGNNQQWRVAENAEGYYTFVNRNSGKSLDVWNWSTAAGAYINQYTLSNANNQQFELVPVGATCGADTVLAEIRSADA